MLRVFLSALAIVCGARAFVTRARPRGLAGGAARRRFGWSRRRTRIA